MKLFLTALIVVFSLPIGAAEINMNYKSFYSHLKELEDEEVNRLEFTFGFVHVGGERLCKLNQVEIITQKQTLSVDVGADNRFRLPTEKALKMANANVRIDMAQASNVCDMSVQLQLQPKYLASSYSGDELATFYQQFNAFFDQMGGFLSFLMPGPQGLQLHFAQPVSVGESLSSQSMIEDTTLWLAAEDISTLSQLSLSQMPHKVTVWMED